MNTFLCSQVVRVNNVTLGLYDAVVFSYKPSPVETTTTGDSTTTTTTLGAANVVLSVSLIVASFVVIVVMT